MTINDGGWLTTAMPEQPWRSRPAPGAPNIVAIVLDDTAVGELAFDGGFPLAMQHGGAALHAD
jgi:hypothetical protein